MNFDNNINISNITAASVDRYLQLNGWIRNYNFANKNLMVFNFSKNKEKSIALPILESFDDFYTTLSGILQKLSFLENRDIRDILKDISTTFIDRLEFRVISKATDDGKLPIEYAAECINGLRELILYSACAEQNARPICFRATDLAKGYLENFKLAQTEKGSFIINIDIQVVDEANEQIVLDDCGDVSSFEHKIVKRISTAIAQVDEVVKNKKPLSEIAQNAYENGITANMCEALLKLKPERVEAQIAATIRYASAITKKTGITEKIDIQTNHFLVMNELSKIYRDNVLVQDVTLVGIIRTLSKRNIDEEVEKTIRLYTTFEGKNRTVTIELENEQYRIACDAHKDGLEVRVAGELDMSGRHWIITKVTEFTLADN